MVAFGTDLAVHTHSLPIIDISPWLQNGSSTHGHNGGRSSTAAALHAACLDYGFFYLDISSYVDTAETDELTRLAHEFFDLPQEEKDKLSLTNQDHARGYQRLKENVTGGKADNHEALDFYAPVQNPDKTKPLWGENQWPSVNHFKEKYEIWVEKMKRLGMVVMEAMAAGLGVTPEEWEDMKHKVDDSFWVMRVIGYPPLPNDYDGFSCGAHKDYGCLTFLYADETPNALEVFLPTPNTKTEPDALHETTAQGLWLAANPIPNCVLCNIGEMWEIWTNGLYRSTLHRVLHRGSNYRVSIPFFFEPNFDACISPLAAAKRLQQDTANGGHVHGKEEFMASKDYKAVVYGDFLKSKVANNFSTGKYKYD